MINSTIFRKGESMSAKVVVVILLNAAIMVFAEKIARIEYKEGVSQFGVFACKMLRTICGAALYWAMTT